MLRLPLNASEADILRERLCEDLALKCFSTQMMQQASSASTKDMTVGLAPETSIIKAAQAKSVDLLQAMEAAPLYKEMTSLQHTVEAEISTPF